VSRKATIAGLSISAAAMLVVSPSSAQQTETVDQALCRMIEKSAADYQVPVDYFTRLIWQESSFKTGVVSGAGARGVAQFMPGTAAERGLADPFDPEQAIPKAAELLRDLAQRFGNLGLAAVAYNGGPTRTASWLQGRAFLAAETRSYVIAITGRSADDWAEQARGSVRAEPQPPPMQTEPARAQPIADERAEAGAGGDMPRTGRALAQRRRRPPHLRDLWRPGRRIAARALGHPDRRRFLEGPRARELCARTAALSGASQRGPADGDRHAHAQPREQRVLSRASTRGDARGRDRHVRPAARGRRGLRRPEKLMRLALAIRAPDRHASPHSMPWSARCASSSP
jgi:hypothetical protein